ncbi:MAG: response regulator [Symploca sp. SIO2B6]|nr:response regulator [Symploca sp. SIO2B6]
MASVFSGNILVIDDTPANLQLLLSLLSQQGYRVRPMPSGRLALQGIHLDYPDLILLDIQMPELDGYQVCEQLKADVRTQDIPIIFISALDEVFDKIKAFKVGGVDYITKPFQSEEVLARVRTHITLSKLQKNLKQENKEQDQKLQEQNLILEKTIGKLKDLNQELEKRLSQLQDAQLQLVQSEKMATLGQLVAGIAHEINNPLGFISANIEHTSEYTQGLIDLVTLYQRKVSEPDLEIQECIEDIDLEFMVEDLPKVVASMKMGSQRIYEISSALRTFARKDSEEKTKFNIHDGIESTLMMLRYRLKSSDERPEINIISEYSELPEIDCFPGKINQVFMNVLSNAIDAFDNDDNKRCNQPQEITIRTSLTTEGKHIAIEIQDNGSGIPEDIQKNIFDNLFTTKPVGKGTGLGLAIAYQIITEQHSGIITCSSTLGQGTAFTITLPLHSN